MEILEMVDKIKRVEKLCLQTIREKHSIGESLKSEQVLKITEEKILLANEILTIIEGK